MSPKSSACHRLGPDFMVHVAAPDGAQTESACTSFCAAPSPVNTPTGCGQYGDLCPVRTTTLIPNEY